MAMEPALCSKLHRNLSEKLRAKFPATTCGYSLAKIACLNDAFSGVFEWEALSPVEGQSLQQKDKKRRKRKGKRKLNTTKSLKDVRANCFCTSLLRTQVHMPCHASSARAKY